MLTGSMTSRLSGRVAGGAERVNWEVSQERMPMWASWAGAVVVSEGMGID